VGARRPRVTAGPSVGTSCRGEILYPMFARGPCLPSETTDVGRMPLHIVPLRRSASSSGEPCGLALQVERHRSARSPRSPTATQASSARMLSKSPVLACFASCPNVQSARLRAALTTSRRSSCVASSTSSRWCTTEVIVLPRVLSRSVLLSAHRANFHFLRYTYFDVLVTHSLYNSHQSYNALLTETVAGSIACRWPSTPA
jgi:hypothetical protein